MSDRVKKILGFVAWGIVFVIIYKACTSRSEIEFEQVGMMKKEIMPDQYLRYNTFYIDSETPIDTNKVDSVLINKIIEHGSKEFNTPGNFTASFYYLDRSKTPNITSYPPEEAKERALSSKPFMQVWIMPNGQINVFTK